MKTKILLSVLAITLTISAFSQKSTMELTFTAENNEQYVPLDSIFIENLTQGGDTTLYAPDTVLVLDYITSIGNNETIEENTLSVSQNYPNPFNGKTTVNLYLPEKDDIKITIRDILGREQAQYNNTLNQGNHSFAFYSGNQKYYLLTVTGRKTSRTIKMLNANINTVNSEKCKIVYIGNKGNAISFKTRKAINDFGFNLGDELMFTAYTLTAIGNLGSSVIVDIPDMSKIYEFDILGGLRCPGMPTVTDIDGNKYNTVQIGTQCWMKENLKTTTYQNGTPIPNVTGATAWHDLTTAAYVWYDNDISWKNLYGGLYNWYATVDANGLCPTGWHVPTNYEWVALTNFIGGTGSPHGNELKSCRQVNSPLGGGCNTTEHPRWEEDTYYGNYGTDDYGFSGLPGGTRSSDGPFSAIGNNGIWWPSTEVSSGIAWGRYLYFYAGDVTMYHDFKQEGFSVRCIRD